MEGPEGIWAGEKDKRAEQKRRPNETIVKSRLMDFSSSTDEAPTFACDLSTNGSLLEYIAYGFGDDKLIVMAGRI